MNGIVIVDALMGNPIAAYMHRPGFGVPGIVEASASLSSPEEAVTAMASNFAALTFGLTVNADAIFDTDEERGKNEGGSSSSPRADSAQPSASRPTSGKKARWRETSPVYGGSLGTTTTGGGLYDDFVRSAQNGAAPGHVMASSAPSPRPNKAPACDGDDDGSAPPPSFDDPISRSTTTADDDDLLGSKATAAPSSRAGVSVSPSSAPVLSIADVFKRTLASRGWDTIERDTSQNTAVSTSLSLAPTADVFIFRHEAAPLICAVSLSAKRSQQGDGLKQSTDDVDGRRDLVAWLGPLVAEYVCKRFLHRYVIKYFVAQARATLRNPNGGGRGTVSVSFKKAMLTTFLDAQLFCIHHILKRVGGSDSLGRALVALRKSAVAVDDGSPRSREDDNGKEEGEEKVGHCLSGWPEVEGAGLEVDIVWTTHSTWDEWRSANEQRGGKPSEGMLHAATVADGSALLLDTSRPGGAPVAWEPPRSIATAPSLRAAIALTMTGRVPRPPTGAAAAEKDGGPAGLGGTLVAFHADAATRHRVDERMSRLWRAARGYRSVCAGEAAGELLTFSFDDTFSVRHHAADQPPVAVPAAVPWSAVALSEHCWLIASLPLGTLLNRSDVARCIDVAVTTSGTTEFEEEGCAAAGFRIPAADSLVAVSPAMRWMLELAEELLPQMDNLEPQWLPFQA